MAEESTSVDELPEKVLQTAESVISGISTQPADSRKRAIEAGARFVGKSATRPFPIVGIGISADTLGIYGKLFRSLPHNTGMAFVVICHAEVHQKVRLSQILAPLCSMPVLELNRHTFPAPNHVYVAPADSLLTISGGVLKLEPRSDRITLPFPINHFFASLAADQKNHAVGVVLPGVESDGAIGLRAIKAEGGIAIAEPSDLTPLTRLPENAVVATEDANLLVPAAYIAPELTRLGNQFSSPSLRMLGRGEASEGDEERLEKIFSLLRDVAGLEFGEYTPGTIRRRIARRLILNKLGGLTDYASFLQAHPEELRVLHEDLLIGVTRFFRDPGVFETFTEEILPRLFSARTTSEPVRIWAAGCSSGEEVYSIAMCIIEYLEGHGRPAPSIQVFGTDASEQAIRKARAGIYPETIAEEISPERLRRFFVKLDGGYQVTKSVRDLCTFARHNLCNDLPYSKLDLVSCRNVLFYFNPLLQEQVVRKFHYSLGGHGYLLIGKTETIREYSHLFTTLDRKNKFYAKIPGGERSVFDPWRRLRLGEKGSAGRRKEQPGSAAAMDFRQATDRAILARFDLPAVVVDEHLNIVFTRGPAAPFFKIAPGTPTLHFMRMVREDIAAPLLGALQRAIHEDVPVQIAGIQMREGGRVRDIGVDVVPLENLPGTPRCFLILFTPTADLPAFQRAATSATFVEPGGGDRDELVSQLRKDLQSTKLYMQSLIEERDARYEELASGFNEIQSQCQELQSANEELETANEEIQSAYEDLQTVNDDLHQRNAGLTRMRDELGNLLASVNLPVLILNNEMQIRQFTPAASRVMSVRSSDIGRPLGEIRVQLSVQDLEPIVREVLETLVTKEFEVQDREQRWHLLRVRPYRTNENKIEGAVLSFFDIDQFRRAQSQLRQAFDFSKATFANIQIPLVVLNPDLTIRTANNAFELLAGATAPVEGRSFPDLATAQWEMREVQGRLEEILAQGSAATSQFECKSTDESRVLSMRALAMHAEGEKILLMTVEDITARFRAEETFARERNALLRQVKWDERELKRTQDELRGLAGKLFISQEEERRRVSLELHDDITQKLALLSMALEEFALEAPDPDAQRRLKVLGSQTAALTEDVRKISHRLHPSILDDLGLPIALKALIEEFRLREDMPADFHVFDLPATIPHNVAASLYRIAQEALRNVAKHAGKTHVKVSLEGTPNRIQMEIVDFGQGFDEPKLGDGLGLVSMTERARLVSGKVFVQSAPGKGTTVRVEAPLSPSN